MGILTDKDNVVLSSIGNLKYYAQKYDKKEVSFVLDTNKNTLKLDKVDNRDIYLNTFEDVIYLYELNRNYNIENIILKQGNKLYFFNDDKRYDLDYLISIREPIFVYKNSVTLSLLTQSKDSILQFSDRRDLSNYELLEVKYNGKNLDEFDFDNVLKRLNISGNYLPHQYLNNIQIVLGERVTDDTDLKIVVEDLDHTLFYQDNFIDDIEENYVDITKFIQGFSLDRPNFETMIRNPVLRDKAYHQNSKNFRTQINIKTYTGLRQNSISRYGQNNYGQGLYGVEDNSLKGVLMNSTRFRLVVRDVLTGEVIMINNCKSRDSFTRNYTETGNTIEFIIDGDKEMVFSLSNEDSTSFFYEICNK